MNQTWPTGRSRHGGVDRVPLPGVAGALWLAGKRFVAPDPEAALAAVGADTMVCLCEDFELADRYPGYVEWLRSDERALWFPVADLHAPSPQAAVGLIGRIRPRLETGRTVLMHCGAGIGRAGTLAAALLIDLGQTLDSALSVVAAARPMAGPEVGAQSELLITLSSAAGLSGPPDRRPP